MLKLIDPRCVSLNRMIRHAGSTNKAAPDMFARAALTDSL